MREGSMKVAAVQMDIAISEKQKNLAKILALLESAAVAGAKIVVFPECALTGYCFASKEEAEAVAEPIPGPASEELHRAANSLDCTVVVGMLERDGERIFNAAVVVTPQGIAGAYRKLHLPYLGTDRFVVPGDKPFARFDTLQGKIGINICFDCSFCQFPVFILRTKYSHSPKRSKTGSPFTNPCSQSLMVPPPGVRSQSTDSLSASQRRVLLQCLFKYTFASCTLDSRPLTSRPLDFLTFLQAHGHALCPQILLQAAHCVGLEMENRGR